MHSTIGSATSDEMLRFAQDDRAAAERRGLHLKMCIMAPHLKFGGLTYMSNNGFTIWFTGLSGAGKSTLAEAIQQRLRAGGRNVEVLDGDIVRTHLSKGLGFSREDRDTNIKRIAFVCSLLTRNGVICISAAISPYREAREWARQEIGNFVEVYLKCPLEVCRQRDVKGLYKLVEEGKIKGFTGVDDPYEEPDYPELVIETDREPVEASVRRIVAKLEDLGYLETEELPEDDARLVTDRLAALGYL
jgi:adenylylsulfate kinase